MRYAAPPPTEKDLRAFYELRDAVLKGANGEVQESFVKAGQALANQSQEVRQIIEVEIRQTQDHCSYCDAFPRRLGDDTIDRFRPKGNPAFYHHAYAWDNLYILPAAIAKEPKWSVSQMTCFGQMPRIIILNVTSYTTTPSTR